jgi:hypothetical protein
MMAHPKPRQRPPLIVTFPLVESDPADELTCIFCWGPRCELHTTFSVGGRTIVAGVHEVCAERLERAAAKEGK